MKNPDVVKKMLKKAIEYIDLSVNDMEDNDYLDRIRAGRAKSFLEAIKINKQDTERRKLNGLTDPETKILKDEMKSSDLKENLSSAYLYLLDSLDCVKNKDNITTIRMAMSLIEKMKIDIKVPLWDTLQGKEF